MKIVCDACQAKYSISDDKVQGKVFKIRCKKCSNIIVVRGGAGAQEAAPAAATAADHRVYDDGYAGSELPAGDDAVWHVVINQDQVGPMTAVEVQQRFAGGEIDGETYIWREGFADWLPLSQVDTFVALVASGSTTAATSGRGQDAVAAMFGAGGDDGGTTRSDPGDLFAAAGAAARDDDGGGDLFGQKPAARAAAAPVASSSRGTGSNQAQDDGGGAGGKLRGERNENSVLFSLNNLAQLASDKPAPAAARASGGGGNAPGQATGAAGGEGSGLIDIRSMASAYLGGGQQGRAGAAPASAGVGSIDDLPVFGGGGFSEPAVIVPMGAARQANNKLMYALIGSVGLLAVAAIVVVVVMMKGNNNNQTAATVAAVEKKDEGAKPAEPAKPAETATAPSGATNPGSAAAPAPTPAAPTATADSTPPAPTPAAPTPAAPTPPSHAAAPPAHHDTHHEAAPPHHEAPPTHVASKDPTPAPAGKAAAGGGGDCDDVSCVISGYEGACCAKFKKGGAAKSGGGGGGGGNPVNSSLPDGLDRQMISDSVAKVKGRVMACGDKSSAKGQVKVSVKVDAGGHVSSVTVKNTPDPALGNCVSAAMSRATFPKTQGGGSFGYPFMF
ncbi:MAG TPA: GYF domain-containing protein [Kofleriaceae bacterium]|jgi:predicted Zn finger-like uncharacterized protein